MKTFFSIFGYVVVVVLVADAFCFMLWAMSGQIPMDGFYAGAITANVIHAWTK